MSNQVGPEVPEVDTKDLPMVKGFRTVEDSLRGEGQMIELSSGSHQFRLFDGSETDLKLMLECFRQFSEEVIYQRYRNGHISEELAVSIIRNYIYVVLVLDREEVIGWGGIGKFCHPIEGYEDTTKVEAGLVLREEYHGNGIGGYLSSYLFALAEGIPGVDSCVVYVDRDENTVAYHIAEKYNALQGGQSPRLVNGLGYMFTVPLRRTIEL